MVFVDLPYGATQNTWDKPIPFAEMWSFLQRCTKENAALIFTATQPFASHLIVSNSADFRYDLVWQKNKPTGFLNANKQPLRTHEHLLVFYRKPPCYNPQKTQGHEPGHKAVRAKKSSNYGDYKSTDYGGSTERHPTSVLSIPILNNDSPEKVHPTQKPVELAEWFIRTYTNENDIVLDFTMGVGTTGVGAIRLRRRFVGIELHKPYFEIAQTRLAHAILDQP